MEGDSVTLYTNLSEIHKGDNILWKFGSEKCILAEISTKYGFFSTFDGPDGRFRDRLKLDNQTGSLIITNITTKHAGLYEVKINGVSLKTFSVSVYDDWEMHTDREMSVMEGDSVTLNTDLTEIHEDEDIVWQFENILVSENNGEAGNVTIYDVPDGRFRDRLKLDPQTGSLTITNITNEHSGLYEVQISGAKFLSKTFSVSVYAQLPVANITSDCSLSSASKCSLLCSVVNASHANLSWYKGNSLLSSISVSDLSISLSLPLEVEYQDKNTYSCVINNPISNQTTHLDISKLCHTCSVQSCEEEITYTDPKFYRRNGQKPNVKEESHVDYVPVAMRR
ncbi:SLAM family member 9 [Labeo rohita]|uniref:SLAM family member 9 n=1 Tax=Labeo rohita TaxID=84645 RepID=UPI0021E28163|nr:SLAM family member 9 [Labeo rohita]